MTKTYHISIPYFIVVFSIFLALLWTIRIDIGFTLEHYRLSRGDFSSLENQKPIFLDGLPETMRPSGHELYTQYLSTKAVFEDKQIQINRSAFYSDLVFLVVFIFLAIAVFNSLLFTRAVYDGRTLIVYYPHLAILGLLARPREGVIAGSQYIYITRTTPFSSDLKNPLNMNWRDTLGIGGVAVFGYIYSGLGDLYGGIITDYPDIKTVYHKNTLKENLLSFLLPFQQ